MSPVIERITRPTLTQDGRKAPAFRFGDLRVQALAGAVAAMLFTVLGITSKSLRGPMTGLLNHPCSMNQASYDVPRLARNGLIERVTGRNRYILTRDGLLFACFCAASTTTSSARSWHPTGPTHPRAHPQRLTPSTFSSTATSPGAASPPRPEPAVTGSSN